MSAIVDYIPQRYKSVSEFLAAYRLPASRHRDWRLTAQVVGHISGLPNSFGHLTATDGVLCYIEQPRGRIFQGHIGWFEPAADAAREGEARVGSSSTNTKRERRRISAAELNKVIL